MLALRVQCLEHLDLQLADFPVGDDQEISATADEVRDIK